MDRRKALFSHYTTMCRNNKTYQYSTRHDTMSKKKGEERRLVLNLHRCLGAFPTRAQIQVLSPNRSFSRPTEIPNSFEIPKNYFDFKFCVSLILISGNGVTEFRSFYFMKSKFLQTIIFTKIPSDTCDSRCH